MYATAGKSVLVSQEPPIATMNSPANHAHRAVSLPSSACQPTTTLIMRMKQPAERKSSNWFMDIPVGQAGNRVLPSAHVFNHNYGTPITGKKQATKSQQAMVTCTQH
jgi:hypothetical protein